MTLPRHSCKNYNMHGVCLAYRANRDRWRVGELRQIPFKVIKYHTNSRLIAT